MRPVHRRDHVDDRPRPLPIEVKWEAESGYTAAAWGRVLRLPVLRHRIDVKKEAFVYEEVIIRTGLTERLVGVDGEVLREKLRVDSTVNLAAETVRIDMPETTPSPTQTTKE